MVLQLMEAKHMDFILLPLKAFLSLYLQGISSAELHCAAEPAPGYPLTPRKHFKLGKMLCNKTEPSLVFNLNLITGVHNYSAPESVFL